MKTLILGDVHGSFSKVLNPLLNKKRPDLVLQVGDFGWWPSPPATGWTTEKRYDPCSCIAPGQAQVHFCDGNHENHSDLVELRHAVGGEPQAHEVCPGIFWQDRGSTLTLPDGRVVLFAGGADSVDKDTRMPGTEWWPEELLTREDLDRFPDPAQVSVDIVVSHTCPTFFFGELTPGNCKPYLPEFVRYKFADPSSRVLDLVLERYRPKLWYFGHYHRFRQGEAEGCRWTCLACPPWQGGYGRHWVFLEEE